MTIRQIPPTIAEDPLETRLRAALQAQATQDVPDTRYPPTIEWPETPAGSSGSAAPVADAAGCRCLGGGDHSGRRRHADLGPDGGTGSRGHDGRRFGPHALPSGQPSPIEPGRVERHRQSITGRLDHRAGARFAGSATRHSTNLDGAPVLARDWRLPHRVAAMRRRRNGLPDQGHHT